MAVDYLDGKNYTGGPGDDFVIGNSQNNVIYTYDGDDRVEGGAGNDQIFGGKKADVLLGENGDDTIKGGQGADRIKGGRGNDTIDGGDGNDIVVFDGSRDDFRVTRDGSGLNYTIEDLRPNVDDDEGTDTVTGVEIFRFNGIDHSASQVLTPITDVSLSSYSFNEGPNDHRLWSGQVSVSGGQSSGLTFRLLEGDNRFDIDSSTGRITTHSSDCFDFESTDNPSASRKFIWVEVEVQDSWNHVYSERLPIEILNMAPSMTSPTSFTIDDTAGNGAHVGTVVSQDPCGDPGQPQYSLQDNAGGRFSINSTTGQVQVANSALVDAGSYGIQVQMADSAGLWSNSHGVTVYVNQTNHVPEFLGGDYSKLIVTEFEETAAPGQHVVTRSIQFRDNDLSDSHQIDIVPLVGQDPFLGNMTHTLVDHGNGTHTINLNYAVDDSVVDHLRQGIEVLQDYKISIDDGQGDPSTEDPFVTMQVSLNGRNDTPEFIDGPGSIEIIDPEGPGTPGVLITRTGTFDFTDVDLQDTHTATFSGGDALPGTFSAVVSNSATADGAGTVTWTYEVLETDLDPILQVNPLTGVIEVGVTDSVQSSAVPTSVSVTLRGNATPSKTPVNGTDTDDIVDASAASEIFDLKGGMGDRVKYTQSSAGVTVDLAGSSVGSGGDAVGDEWIGVEQVEGSAFADTISGDGQNNLFWGHNGGDNLSGLGGNDVLLGGLGGDILDGGSGRDLLDYTGSAGGVTVSLATNTASGGDASGDTISNFEEVRGSDQGDALTGDDNPNTLYGGLGNDTLSGLGGVDLLRGGAGADFLDGGLGNDWVDYRNSTDAVSVDLAANTASGGHAAGDSFLSIERVFGSHYDDSLTGTSGNNILYGQAGNDTLNGLDGNDVLTGHAGDDTLNGGAGADTLDGGDGLDWADYRTSTGHVIINLNAGTAHGGHAAGDTLSNIERVYGSSSNDSITGYAAANTLNGEAGNDTLLGLGGDDVLNGGAGIDTLEGGLGADTLDGGDGFDWVDYRQSTSGVQINLEAGTASGGEAAGDIISNVERIWGSSHSDTLIGDGGANILFGEAGIDTIDGGAGDDVIAGGAGADILLGRAGNDWVDYRTSSAGVTVDLGAGTASGGDATGDTILFFERIFGSAFNDTLTGSGDDNVILGGLGDDIMSGLGGNDRFRVGAGDGNDTISGGFDGGAGVGDVIQLVGIAGIGSFADVQAAADDSTGDTVITLSASQSLTIEGTLLSSLAADDFLIT